MVRLRTCIFEEAASLGPVSGDWFKVLAASSCLHTSPHGGNPRTQCNRGRTMQNWEHLACGGVFRVCTKCAACRTEILGIACFGLYPVGHFPPFVHFQKCLDAANLRLAFPDFLWELEWWLPRTGQAFRSLTVTDIAAGLSPAKYRDILIPLTSRCAGLQFSQY